jgi:RsiW-degrading membrane proteinase PrsW (M82 family)
VGWTWLIASLFFTGLIGLPGLLFVYQFLPAAFVKMPFSQYALVRLAGMIAMVGISEELLKVFPVVAYLSWNRKRADPMTALLVGVFSGLGFAAFENMAYGDRSVRDSFDMAQQFGPAGHALGVREAMVTALFRSLSLVFCHAVWSGITAYFALMAFLTPRRAPLLASTGILLAALLHGSYNWLAGIQLTFATLVVAGSFVLFYAYVTKLRNLVASASEAEDTSDASDEFDHRPPAEPSLTPART